jgi:hypothetical protein
MNFYLLKDEKFSIVHSETFRLILTFRVNEIDIIASILRDAKISNVKNVVIL